MKKLTSRKHGFTLIELMIVMAIIAILAVLGIAAIQSARRTARDTQRRSNAKTFQVALEGYQAANKDYPANPAGAGIEVNNAAALTKTGAVLNTYVSGTFEDPGPPTHSLKASPVVCSRYWYNRLGNSTYELRVSMESVLATEGAAPVNTGESFDMQ